MFERTVRIHTKSANTPIIICKGIIFLDFVLKIMYNVGVYMAF